MLTKATNLHVGEESSISSKIIQTTSLATFGFRPWVKKAGLSIVGLAAVLTAAVVALAAVSSDARFGWAGEPFVAVYLAALWVGGGKVYLGTWRPIAELREHHLVLRPLHLFGQRAIPWEAIAGTEQRIRGDRLVVYYRGGRGLRFVALNLNLVRGRRELMRALEERLQALGFVEKLAEESRYLSRA
jgi:hypothetical protein